MPFDYKPYTSQPAPNILDYQLAPFQVQEYRPVLTQAENRYPNKQPQQYQNQPIAQNPNRSPLTQVENKYSTYYQPQPQYQPAVNYYQNIPRRTTTTTKITTTTRRPFTTPRTIPSHESFKCGERQNKNQALSLIIGGAKAKPYDFPWLVAHFHREHGFICGGSLVSRKIVVTAAHCMFLVIE